MPWHGANAIPTLTEQDGGQIAVASVTEKDGKAVGMVNGEPAPAAGRLLKIRGIENKQRR